MKNNNIIFNNNICCSVQLAISQISRTKKQNRYILSWYFYIYLRDQCDLSVYKYKTLPSVLYKKNEITKEKHLVIFALFIYQYLVSSSSRIAYFILFGSFKMRTSLNIHSEAMMFKIYFSKLLNHSVVSLIIYFIKMSAFTHPSCTYIHIETFIHSFFIIHEYICKKSSVKCLLQHSVIKKQA